MSYGKQPHQHRPDGAVALTGKTTGLIAKFKRDFPSIHSIQCLAYRLELAVHDSLKEVAECNHLQAVCPVSPVREERAIARGSSCRSQHANFENWAYIHHHVGGQQF